jgi:hypothetical protein
MASELTTRTEVASAVRDRFLQSLGDYYVWTPGQPIAEFFEQYPFVAGLLAEAIGHIRKQFGENTVPVIELLGEDDVPGFTELFATVRTRLSPDEASAKLDAFDREWWLDASVNSGGRLNFSVESL